MAVMTSDDPSHHPPFLRLDHATHQPSRRHHSQSLLGPSIHDPRTPHVLESHSKRAASLSRRDDERQHVGAHSALALRLYLAASLGNPSSSCRDWVFKSRLDHLCSNLSKSFLSSWITETWSLNLCVCVYLFLFYLCFSDRNRPQLWIPVCNLDVITSDSTNILNLVQFPGSLRNIEPFWYLCCAFCVSRREFPHLTQALSRFHLSSAADDKGIVNYLHEHLFPKVLHRRRHVRSRRLMYLLIVGSDYCVMACTSHHDALHMRRQNLVPLSCLYTQSFELVAEIVFQYCTTPFSTSAPRRWCFCVAH